MITTEQIDTWLADAKKATQGDRGQNDPTD